MPEQKKSCPGQVKERTQEEWQAENEAFLDRAYELFLKFSSDLEKGIDTMSPEEMSELLHRLTGIKL